tara:strand:+ start:13266 stop:14990 length:1725 start_codon:yes stop_codon:yes gene_type:complete
MSQLSLRSFLCASLFGGAFLTTTFVAPGTSWAQEEGDRVADLIELVRKRPSGKDRDAWRDERREAARELGTLGDARAVPVLIQIVKTEQFDAVGEIAIVSLGKLGDEQAIPVLQEVADDSSRDRFVRKSARSALKKLGAEPAADDEGDDDDSEDSFVTSGLGSVSVSAPTASGPIKLASDFGDDMLAASDELTFGIGDGRLSYDTVRKEGSFAGQAQTRYLRIRERKSMALRFEGRGDLVSGIVNYEGDDSSSRLASVNLAGAAQARFYEGSGRFFGIGSAGALLGFDHLRVNRPGNDNTSTKNLLSGEFDVFLGAGYGRILDKGEALRVRRLASVLEGRKLLGRPISPDLGERIMRAWWMLRSEIGYHDRLVATVSLLREAGVLLGEPDAGTSYALLQVLSDGQLSHRKEGLQIHAGLGESVLFRDDDLGLEEGRIETVSTVASYGRQNLEGDSEVRAEGVARYRVLAEEDEASPWAALGSIHWRDYHYGKNFDPIGALDLGVNAGVSKDGLEDSELATRVGGSIGWLWIPSRASRFRVAAEGRLESSEMFLGVTFEGRYGLIDAGYVGGASQ